MKFKVFLKADFKISLEKSLMGSGAVAPEVIQTADQLIQVHTQTKWLVFVPLIT